MVSYTIGTDKMVSYTIGTDKMVSYTIASRDFVCQSPNQKPPHLVA